MKIFRFLLSMVLAGVAFASIVPHMFPNYWLTDIFSHFKLQYILLLMLLLPASLFLVKKRMFAVVITLLLLAWNSWFTIPLYLGYTDSRDIPDQSFSILTMNLLASNNDFSGAIELIREKDPDVIVLLELSPQWEKEMRVLDSDFPFRKLIPQRDNFGIGILSRIPMDTMVLDFGKGFPPSILSIMEFSHQQISILATHPVPPVNKVKFKLRNEQLKEIAEFIKVHETNFILAGDLNTSSFSKHFQELLKVGELKDSRKGFGILSTWPTDLFLLRTTLDHFLIKGEMEVINRTTERSIGSDHLPIFMEIAL